MGRLASFLVLSGCAIARAPSEKNLDAASATKDGVAVKAMPAKGADSKSAQLGEKTNCNDGSWLPTMACSPLSTPPQAPPATPSPEPPLGIPAYAVVPSHVPIAMEPPVLSFEPWPLCIPKVSTVEIINTSEDEVVDIHSVSQTSKHFHVSQFNLTRLPPLGRLSFSVVFLPRALGSVNGTLLIQTSAGGFFYGLTAVGEPSPYDIEPIDPMQVPKGTPYTPPLWLTNPHDTPMRINEVFTSESFLHLALPPAAMVGGAPAPGLQDGLWLVSPSERKHVISLSFTADVPGRYDGYVHILTDYDTLVIPVSIEVTDELVRRPPLIDFGVLTSADATTMRPLTLMSTATSVIALEQVENEPNDAPLRFKPQLTRVLTNRLLPMEPTEVLHATFSGATEGFFEGQLALRTDSDDPHTRRIVVPWRARVLHGTLSARITATEPDERTAIDGSKGVGLSLQSEITLNIGNHFAQP